MAYRDVASPQNSSLRHQWWLPVLIFFYYSFGFYINLIAFDPTFYSRSFVSKSLSIQSQYLIMGQGRIRIYKTLHDLIAIFSSHFLLAIFNAF
jgi:hypothetical protein